MHGLFTEDEFITHPHEHVLEFIEMYGVVPDYVESEDFIYGYIDEVTGEWTGMVGNVGLDFHQKDFIAQSYAD